MGFWGMTAKLRARWEMRAKLCSTVSAGYLAACGPGDD